MRLRGRVGAWTRYTNRCLLYFTLLFTVKNVHVGGVHSTFGRGVALYII